MNQITTTTKKHADQNNFNTDRFIGGVSVATSVEQLQTKLTTSTTTFTTSDY
jgi:hypothetical protein